MIKPVLSEEIEKAGSMEKEMMMDKRIQVICCSNKKTEKMNKFFVEAMKENLRFHDQHCEAIHRILMESGCSLEEIRSMEDLAKIPSLPTLLFKRHLLFSMPQNRMIAKVSSSGTRGHASQVGFDLLGLICAFLAIFKQVTSRKLLSLIPCHYIMLGYKPHRSNKAVISKTAYATSWMAPSIKRTFALTMKNGQYEADLNQIEKALMRAAKSPFPTRIIGFPSYAYFLLKKMEEKDIRIKLPKGSKILLGGGWKQFYQEEVEKTVLYEMAERILGIKEDQIIEFFGAAEHAVIYCDCPHHHFHIPQGSHVIIRDPKTLEPLPMGQVGLINLLSPLNRATPLYSIMTDDLGVLHDGKDCPCQNKTPYLEILGRVGIQDIKTCAAGAKERLEKTL